MEYYVYSHLANEVVFYVGKGKGKRAWSKLGRSDAWRLAAANGFEVRIVASGLDESAAFEVERRHIAAHRQTLCNKTSGGQGISGYRHTDDAKARISTRNSIAQTGLKRSEAHRKAISNGSKGRPKSARMVERLKATKNTPESKAKASLIGKRNAQDPAISKRKSESLSRAMLGRQFSDSHRLAISKAQGGKPVTCLDTGVRFETATDAAAWAKTVGKPKAWSGNITAACKGRLKSAYGLRWQFAQ